MRVTNGSRWSCQGLAAALLLGAWGCGPSVVRRPVPPALADRVQVPDMPGSVRAWGDAFSPTLQQSVVDGIEPCVRAYGDKYPTVALALSGGGSDGAFGAGLLCGWTDRGDRPTFRMVTGVSAGAIIAPFAFLGPAYDRQLRLLSTTLTNDRVFQPKGVFAALLSDSFTDTAPLVAEFAKVYDRDLLRAVAAEHAKGRRLFVATTNLDAQRPVIWDLGKIAAVDTPAALDLFRTVILASAAIPVLFPPVYIDVTAGGRRYDEMHVDGGTTTQVILYGDAVSLRTIRDHERLPFKPAPAAVYVIRNAKLTPEPQQVRPEIGDITGRAVSTLTKSQGIGDLYRLYAVARRSGLAFHLASIPANVPIPASNEFDPKQMTALFNVGYDLGRAGYKWDDAPPGLREPDEEKPRPTTAATTRP